MDDRRLQYSEALREEVLQAIRASGPVTNRQLCERVFGVPYANDRNGPVIRQCVHELRLAGNFIAADTANGYWIESDPAKQMEYVNKLSSRIRDIQQVRDVLGQISRNSGAGQQALFPDPPKLLADFEWE